MEMTILDSLKAHLNSITKEEFLQEWNEIKSMGLGGPSVDNFIASFYLGSSSAKLSIGNFNSFNIEEKIVIAAGETNSYAMAA
jgi:hypothetical protein